MLKPRLCARVACVTVMLFFVASCDKPGPNRNGYEQAAVNAIEKLGGKVERDDALPGKPIVKVNVGATPATDEVMEFVRVFKELRELYLYNTDITDDGLVHLKHLPKLQRLDLSSRRITDAGVRHLDDLRNLAHLHLADAKVTEDGVLQFAGLPKLKVLTLHGIKLTDKGLGVIRAKCLEIEELDISESSVADVGIQRLNGLKKLKHLRLRHTDVSDAGMKNLSELPALEYLEVTGTRVTGAFLKDPDHYRALRGLILADTPATDGDLDHLRGRTKLTRLGPVDNPAVKLECLGSV